MTNINTANIIKTSDFHKPEEKLSTFMSKSFAWRLQI